MKKTSNVAELQAIAKQVRRDIVEMITHAKSGHPGGSLSATGSFDGGGTTQLILDTGAQGTLISPTALAALGISYRNAVRGSIKGVTGDANVLAVRIESIEVEGARFGPLMVVSHDSSLGSGRDGLLGRDFLDNFIVTIDSAARVVTLTPKK